MRQGFFALLTADPLRGALRPVEARLLEEARGEALFLVPYPLRDLAEAWRLAYRSLGLKRGKVLYLRRRAFWARLPFTPWRGRLGPPWAWPS